MREQSSRDLEILQAVAENNRLTQRDLAGDLGMAVSLANLYLRRLAMKGFIRIMRVRPNRLNYLLTPKGMAEKSRLTYIYMTRTFERYREARQQLRRALAPLGDDGSRRVAFYGTGEAAEVAYLCLKESGLELGEVFETEAGGEFLGRRVRGLEELIPGEFDRIVVATFEPEEGWQAKIQELVARGASREQIVTLKATS